MFCVLYVDDDLALLEIGKIYLEKIGRFSVDIITSALDALHLITSKKYDAIISDYEMPQMNGIDFLKQIRNSGNTIPFILFTGRGREEIVIQALNEGADYYIQKGADTQPLFTELSHKVSQAVKRRITESALAESEERYRAIVEDQTELICRFTPDGRLTFVNDAYCRYFNLDKNHCLFHPHSVKLLPKDALLMKCHLASLSPDNPAALIEHRICMQDGTILWQRWSDRAIFGKEGHVIEYQSVGRDITERRRAEEALRVSEEKYRELFSSVMDAVFVHEFAGPEMGSGNFIEVNAKACQMFGYTRDELLMMSPVQFLAPEFSVDLKPMIKQLMHGEDASIEEVLVRKDQQRIPVEVHSHAFIQGGKRLIISLIHDITERKRRENALQESEEHLRLLFNSSNDAKIVHRLTTDKQPGEIVEVNTTMCQRYGYSRDELLQMRLQDIEADKDRAVLSHDIVHHLMTEGRATWESIHITKNGHTFPVEIVNTIFEQGGEKMILASARDITKRKQVENALRQTNRQNTLMTIITRHDIINQITIILANIDNAKMEFTDPAMREFIKKIESATEVIKSQIEFTRVYQDLGKDEPKWLELDGFLHLLQVPVTITMTSDLHRVEIFVDPMFEKVFFNLLDNSIRHGERVTKIHVSSIQTDIGLTVIWEDNGIGIASDKKEQVFHRGFGKNTGFGLFLVREILSLTGATITETGELGIGARFEIFVPKGGYRIISNSHSLLKK